MAKLIRKIPKPMQTVKAEPSDAPVRDTPVRKAPPRAGPEFNPAIVQKILRAVYLDGLHRGGTEKPEMTDAQIDMNCLFYGAPVRAALRECVRLGLIQPEDLK